MRLIVKISGGEIWLDNVANGMTIEVRGPRGGSYAYFSVEEQGLRDIAAFIKLCIGEKDD